MKTGRNEPCPCGSGKKYKNCHLRLDEANPGPMAEASRDVLERTCAQARSFARQRFGAAWPPGREVGFGSLDRPGVEPLLEALDLFALPVEGRPAGAWFLDERGPGLDPAQKALLESMDGAWLSIWRVADRLADGRLRAEDLLTGEVRVARDASGGAAIPPRGCLLAFLGEGGEAATFHALHPSVLPPRVGSHAVELVREALEAGPGRIRPERLGRKDAIVALVDLWEDLADEFVRGPIPATGEEVGEDLEIVVDRYDVEPGQAAEVRRRLGAIPDVEADDEGPGAWSLYRYGTVGGMRTILGRALLAGADLELEADTLSRADAWRGIVEEACRGLVVHRVRERTSLAEAADRDEVARSAAAGEDSSRRTRDERERRYREWLDGPNPALGGDSPRQAARTTEGRRALISILDHMEADEAELPPRARFDVGSLRRELGL